MSDIPEINKHPIMTAAWRYAHAYAEWKRRDPFLPYSHREKYFIMTDDEVFRDQRAALEDLYTLAKQYVKKETP